MQLSAIKVNPKNPRLIKDAKADKLMQSLLSFPEMLSLRPIIVDKKGFALGGNMRFLTIERIVALSDAEFQEACAKYKVSPANVKTWQEVRDSKQVPDAWVLKADKLTPDQQREFVIKDNVSGGEWDWDVLANEWDVQDLEDWGLDIPVFETEATETQEDEYDDTLPKHPETVLGDLYEIGEHRLLCGDSTDSDQVARLMNGEKADMVFTDPPYGISVVKSEMVGANFGVAKKGKYSEVIADDTTKTAQEFYQTCVALGMDKFIIWGGNYFTDFLPFSDGWLIWNKRANTDIRNTFADGEMAWCSFHTPIRIYDQLWNGMIREGEKEKRVHPTQKPIRMLSKIIEDHIKGKLIFDGFLGSGSTMVASHQLKRKCYAMELDCKYVDVIVKRILKLDKALTIKKNGKDETKKWLELID